MTNDHLHRLEKVYLSGPADLAVEVVSRESRKRDLETKFKEYAEGGVPEYWLINPLNKKAKFYQLDEAKTYQEQALDSEGEYNSLALTDFWLRPAWLWQKELPSVQKVLQEIGGPKYLEYQLRTGGPEYARQLIDQLQKGNYLQTCAGYGRLVIPNGGSAY